MFNNTKSKVKPKIRERLNIIPSLSDIGNVSEIVARFGGTDQFRSAVNQLQEHLCAA